MIQRSTHLAIVIPAEPRGERWRRSRAIFFRSWWRHHGNVAWTGVFPHRLFPTIEEVALSFYQLTVSGILPHHAIQTVIRLLSGFAIAGVVGVTIGVLMGRSRRAEDIFLPLVSIGAPIPGLAYAPLFLLWFGLGNISAVLLVGFVAAFPIIFTSWTGVKR